MNQFIRMLVLVFSMALAGGVAHAAIDKIDLNTATATQLQTIKGIGPKLAASIVKYRTEHHGFKNLDDLQSVRGVGPKNYLKFKEHLTIHSSSSKTK